MKIMGISRSTTDGVGYFGLRAYAERSDAVSIK